MRKPNIEKSFKLDSEPVLYWPKSPAKVVCHKGVALKYSGKGMAYTLQPRKGSAVELVGWDPQQGFAGWRNVFAEPQLRPTGLLTLAQLDKRTTAQAVCEWVSLNGLLGFHPTSNPVEGGGHFIPSYAGDALIYYYEPVDCIRAAAQRAANVLQLWSALKASYTTGQVGGSDGTIRSLVTFDKGDSYEHRQVRSQRPTPKSLRGWPKFADALRKEEGTDTDQGSAEIGYRVLVNGERRSQQPIPKSPRGWRSLASALLAEYIQEHIQGEVRVSLDLQVQNKDEEERNIEPAPDWNLKPVWKIQSALAAYYVELLMVMRRFRSCKVCGKDISHQKAKSLFCGNTSTCRSVDWHRQKAAKRKAPTDHIG